MLTSTTPIIAPSVSPTSDTSAAEILDAAAAEADEVLGADPVGSPVVLCSYPPHPPHPSPKPIKKVVLGTIMTVTFQGDHRDSAGKKLLKRSKHEALMISQRERGRDSPPHPLDSEFGDTFDEFLKPEWDVTRGGSADCHPVSYTKRKQVVVDIEIKFTVLPAGQSAQLTKLQGTSSNGFGYFTFEKTLSRSVKTERIAVSGLTSKDVLPNRVWEDRDDIQWSATVDGKLINLGTTGLHQLYITFDTPTGQMSSPRPNHFTESGNTQIVTEKRLEFAVVNAFGTGESDEQECVDAIFKNIMNSVGYVLFRRWEPDPVNNTGVIPKPSLHHYFWLCISANGQGECHNIAAAFALCCRILGVKGSFEVGYMYPRPSRLERPPTYPKPNPPTKSPSGQNILGKYSTGGGQYIRDHSGQGHGEERLLFLDGADDPNNFEGVACYKGKALYAIGDDVFDSFPDPDDNASCYYSQRDLDTNSRKIRRAVTDRNK
jgi:hypothetical protein